MMSKILHIIRNYFSSMWQAFKQLFTRIGWQGMLIAVVVAWFLAVGLPWCAHH